MCTNHLLKHLQVFGRFTFPLSHSFRRGKDVTANLLSKCVIVFVSLGATLPTEQALHFEPQYAAFDPGGLAVSI